MNQHTTTTGRPPRQDEVTGIARNLAQIVNDTDLDVVPTLDELDLLERESAS